LICGLANFLDLSPIHWEYHDIYLFYHFSKLSCVKQKYPKIQTLNCIKIIAYYIQIIATGLASRQTSVDIKSLELRFFYKFLSVSNLYQFQFQDSLISAIGM
jgi:hypothetical protein